MRLILSKVFRLPLKEAAPTPPMALYPFLAECWGLGRSTGLGMSPDLLGGMRKRVGFSSRVLGAGNRLWGSCSMLIIEVSSHLSYGAAGG
jgi:hypothetical protein